LKALQNNVKIPYLSEAATDEEIKAARRALCKLEEEIREIKEKILFDVKIQYDKYNTQKGKKIKSLCINKNSENNNEEVFEAKSKEIMKGLGMRRENIVSTQNLLAKMD
jgi:hypothetical protein